MSSNIDIVQRLNKACEAKDFETIKTLLHPKYTLKDPMMELKSPQEFIQFMKDCPFSCHLENVSFVSEGNKVVQTLDAVMTDPVAYRFRMCDVLTLEDGKVRSEEVFYDTAQIPKEAMEIAQRSMQGRGKAA